MNYFNFSDYSFDICFILNDFPLLFPFHFQIVQLMKFSFSNTFYPTTSEIFKTIDDIINFKILEYQKRNQYDRYSV